MGMSPNVAKLQIAKTNRHIAGLPVLSVFMTSGSRSV